MPLDMRFDLRLLERNLNKGIITKEQYQSYLEGLKDAEEKSEKLHLVQPDAPALRLGRVRSEG